MTTFSERIDVDVPVRVAYDQWTQFESFPQFMEAVDRVEQVDDTTLNWTATIAGITKHWRARIVEQRPDEVVSWESTEGARNDGAVRFESLGPNRTRIELTIDVDPDGLVETAGAALGIVERQVKGDLERFRDYVEGSGAASGAWRGRIEDGVVSSPAQEAPGAPTGSAIRS
jgi:uncharacterized membrane protein